MNKEVIDSINDELVMLSLICDVDIEHDDVSYYANMEGVTFTLFFYEKLNQYAFLSNYHKRVDGNWEKVFPLIKELILRKIKGEI